MSINITLKPTYEIPLIGVVGAAAQLGFRSDKIDISFRINGLKIIFGDDHIDNVLHYFLIGTTDALSAVALSEGTNIFGERAFTPWFIGHSMIRYIKFVKEYPQADRWLKVHVVNNNVYAIQVNASVIVEEI